MKSLVIEVSNLSKKYQLGTIGYGSLQHDLSAWWAKARGKEDPNTKIGEKSKRDLYGEFWALQDVSLKVREGDRLGIVGRNGAGKSTLLKLLSRVTTPTSGTIKLRGRVASLLEVGTGFNPELTGRENLFLNGAILGMKRREIQSKFDEIVDFSGVEKFIDTPVKRYSSGMYVRLAFSVAAHLDSDILIVDEVLAVGDAEFQRKCIGKMGDVSTGSGKTVLFVSHNLAAIRSLCNSGVLLEKGKVALEGGIDQVAAAYVQEKKQLGDDGIVWLNDSYRRQEHSRDLEFEFITPARVLKGGQTNVSVQFSIGIEGKYPVKGFGFSGTVLSAELTPVGSFYSSMGLETMKPEKRKVICNLEVGNLQYGDYFLNISLIKMESTGATKVFDAIYEALSFSVPADEIPWQPSFGAIRFDLGVGLE